jgi:maltooligosyltrehalose trehalohydrolase
MHTFKVWAPIPSHVELQVAGQKVPMAAGPGGWWTAEAPLAGAGTDYGFILDGQGPFPDPRSPWQPAGVHGLSRVIDHSAFHWNDAAFQAPPLSSAVIYELHTGTFTPKGTFSAAIDKLDHLVDLGITHVELMPVGAFPGSYGWGYDGVSLYAPHSAYGSPDDLKRLINTCHARGLAVLLDVVYNHLGPSGNYLGRYGPYFTSRYSTPWGSALNYDYADSDEVRRFFCDNALMWLRDYHFDGLRLDAIHAIVDLSALPFLEQLAAEVKQLEPQLGRRLVLIAESDLNAPRVVLGSDRGGYGFDAQWSDDFHHALHAVLTSERNGYYADFGSVAALAKALQHAFVRDGAYSVHRRCRMGRPPLGLAGDRFLAYLQNHDQVGNRAQGERSGQLMSLGRLKVGAALVLTSPFVPLLFQGEEWGSSTPFPYFADHQEPGLANAVREGRRREFAAFGSKPEEIPDPCSSRTFQRSKLDWSELGHEPHAGLLDWHRRLIRLRRSEPDLAPGPLGSVDVCFDEHAGWLSMERGRLTVVSNLGSQRHTVPLRAGAHQPLLISEPGAEFSRLSASLPPDSIAILRG